MNQDRYVLKPSKCKPFKYTKFMLAKMTAIKWLIYGTCAWRARVANGSKSGQDRLSSSFYSFLSSSHRKHTGDLNINIFNIQSALLDQISFMKPYKLFHPTPHQTNKSEPIPFYNTLSLCDGSAPWARSSSTTGR